MVALAHPPAASVSAVTCEQTWNAPWMQTILDQLNDSGFRDDTHPAKRDIGRWYHPFNLFLRFRADGEDAGFICLANKGNATLELHPCFLPEFRGSVTHRAGQQGIDAAFFNTECEQVTTFGLAQSLNWRHAAMSAGFRELYRREWPNTVLGQKVTMVHYGITIDEWLTRSAERVGEFSGGPARMDSRHAPVTSGLSSLALPGVDSASRRVTYGTGTRRFATSPECRFSALAATVRFSRWEILTLTFSWMQSFLWGSSNECRC